jgi:hypothetical protein
MSEELYTTTIPSWQYTLMVEQLNTCVNELILRDYACTSRTLKLLMSAVKEYAENMDGSSLLEWYKAYEGRKEMETK